MRLFITGATGLIGRRLVLDRLERGDQLVLLSRDAAQASTLFAAAANRNLRVVQGNPGGPGPWQNEVAGSDAVLHLAGATIAGRRWSSAYKRTLFTTRIDSTHQVVSAIEQAPPARRPRMLVNASAIGYYGRTGSMEVDETGPPGPKSDFLAQLCVAWEEQALRAEALGVRVALLRTGHLLDTRGGVLAKMLPLFRAYLGGKLGSGRQFMSWIHWRDLLGLIDLALADERARGPMNGVAPAPVTNRDFAHELGLMLNRPSWLPVPRFALRLVMGELAKYATMSQRIVPAKAKELGYTFLYPELPDALRELLGREDEPRGITPGDIPLLAARMNLGSPPQPRAAATESETRETASPSAPIKLIAIDIEGTLLRRDGSIPQGVIQACRAAERAGCAIVFATARPPRGMKMILQAFDVHGPTINYNGAVIWNPEAEPPKPQYHEPLAGDIARQIIEDARVIHPQMMVAVEVLDQWFTDRPDTRFMGEDSETSKRPNVKTSKATSPPEIASGNEALDVLTFGRFDVSPDGIMPLDQLLAQPITKLNLLGLPGAMQAVLDMVREKYWKPRTVAVFLGDPQLIQIAHPMVDKGIALQRIAKRMNLRREEVMAIGDGPEDQGMIEWSGFGVAMANAYPTVRELADAVVPSCDEMGVARALQRFVLAKKTMPGA